MPGDWDDFRLEFDLPPGLASDADVVPLLGKANVWTPEDETPPAEGETCPRCRRSIGHGSRSFCPRCALSGHERRLAEQRAIAGSPPPEPPEGRWDYVPRRPKAPAPALDTCPRPPSRRERRARQYGRTPEMASTPEDP
jgi:hypothetical protein